MKRNMIGLLAICGTALSPVVSLAAYADTIPEPSPAALSDATREAMQAQCDAFAQSYDTGNGDIWSGEVVLGAATKISGPTEVEGSRDIDEATIQHAGTYVPAVLEIRGDPFRIGGSVNMFGDRWSTAGYWTDSTYNYTADFVSTFSHAFSCAISQEVYHEGYTVFHPAEGEYVVNGDFGNSEDAVRGNCAAMTRQGFPLETRPDWWGVEILRGGNPNDPHCRFEGTQAYVEDVPERWDPPALRYTLAGVAVEQEQTDSLYAFEDHGGPVQVTGEYHVGQAVICISPNKPAPGGTWRTQNGYTGNKCTTAWFKVAPWGAGTESSNGTYISVPNYSF